MPRVAKAVEPTLEQWLRDGVNQANQVLYHCNADYDTEMGSTLTVALLYKRRLYVANVGDSRVYHYRPGQSLRCLTKDHTLAASLVEADLLQPDEVASSPKRHQLQRQLGKSYRVTIDLEQHEVQPNDTILLCSDGLWHMLPNARIQELLTRVEDPQHTATLLIEAANSAGGEGNISAIVIRIL
jgi:serine/threonine protein phosphatase PrpC